MSLTDQQAISTLKEIFDMTITEATNAYRYHDSNLENTIQALSTQMESSKFKGPIAMGPANRTDATRHGPTTDVAINVSTGAPSTNNNNHIDLTQDDDLQRALALSLQDQTQAQGKGGDGGPITLEEQELSRALEASLAENQAGINGSPLFVDPLNPHERKRSGNEPIGLKNIGNTCWFSSVIQSLFNIPVFREFILQYKMPPATDSVSECVLFVAELQKLFALLLRSRERYINPKAAIELLRPVFNQSMTTQQDVSEFTHKLLEMVENAFKHSLSKDKPNPIVQLFTGQCVTEGVINKEAFVNRSQFGAFPVQVGGGHLHDCLEAATDNKEMEQETWFTRLPPILVVMLSRFKYDQSSGQVQKIHDRLAFDRHLYMDRYLQVNSKEVRQRRKEVTKLRRKIELLKSTLNRYSSYNNRDLPITDILSLALHFTSRHGNMGVSGGLEEGEAEPTPRWGTAGEVGTVRSCVEQWIKEMETEMAELKESLLAMESTLAAMYTDPSMNRTGYRLHAVLVHQGQASGGHYWAYVRRNHASSEGTTLEASQEAMQQEGPVHEEDLVEIFDKDSETLDMEVEGPTLKATPPEALQPIRKSGHEEMVNMEQVVMVDKNTMTAGVSINWSGNAEGEQDITSTVPDEGTVNPEEVWLKYNDVSVCKVGWNEVLRESYGDNNNSNTSAYCLVYINMEAEEQWKEKEANDSLSEDLQKYVQDANETFEKELKTYDLMKSNLSPQKSDGNIKPAKAVRFTTPDRPLADGSPRNQMIAQASDAKRARAESPLEDMQIELQNLPPVEIDPLLSTQLDARLTQKLRQLSLELPPSIEEPRLLSEFHYACYCSGSDKVRQAMLLQEVAAEATKEGCHSLSNLARKNLLQLLKEHDTLQNELTNIRKLYSMFCAVCYHCTQSVNLMKQDKWCFAMPHTIHSYSLNANISLMATSDQCAMDPKILGALRAKNLLEVSSIGTAHFATGETSTGLFIGNDLIVPSFKAFALNNFTGDDAVMEKVREEWCLCLDQGTVTEDDSDKLADLLVKIVEDYSKAADISIPHTPSSFDTQKLAAQFSNALRTVKKDIIPNPDTVLADYKNPDLSSFLAHN